MGPKQFSYDVNEKGKKTKQTNHSEIKKRDPRS